MARSGSAPRNVLPGSNPRAIRIAWIAGLLAVSTVAHSAQHAEPAQGEETITGRLAPLLENLGDLHFPVTTRSAFAQKFVNQGLTLIYAFNHAEALRAFKEAARLDPDCAMAYWGQALALAPNINDSAIGPDREQQGREAVAEAVKRAPGASRKEQALINALAARFSSGPEFDRERLNQAYAEAMALVNRQFGDDPDVATLYADAVMNTMPWQYWTVDKKPKKGIAEARSALERALKRHPRHPGVHHIYIHLMEASDEVDLAEPSADRLGALVPAAGHLVHMPSHIYIRVGRYDDAAAANIKAVAADEDYITQCRAQGIYPAAYYPHNIHFLNAALAMQGRMKDALAAARKVAGQHDPEMMQEPGFGFAHLLKAIPLLTMVRFGLWDEILAEPAPAPDLVFGRAMRHFARGFALAAKGEVDAAGTELELLRETASASELETLKIMDLNGLNQVASIAVAMLDGELALKSGRHPEAIAAFRRAVEIDDGLRYSEPPDWMLPPRQYLAHALATAGSLEQAEQVYREDLNRHRSNGWSLYGLAQVLRRRERTGEAEKVTAQFARAWSKADVQLTSSRF